MKKYNKLMKFSCNLLPVFLVVILSTTSCMSGFDDINNNKDGMPIADLNKDNLWASYVQSMQLSVFAEDDNYYQRMDELCGNIYSGYSGQADAFGGANPTHYSFSSTYPWNDYAFKVAYGTAINPKYPVPGIMNTWNIVRQKIDSSSVVFAVGEVVKVTGMHRLADMYGPIPYTKYGKSLYTEYDSQETVYKAFFNELNHAIDILTIFYNGSPGAKPIAAFDVIYESDMLKWVKYANSLKLRLAMRIRFVEPELARKYAQEALAHPLGLIEDNQGTAMVKTNSIYPFTNPIAIIHGEYADMRMGASMESYLVGYEDPRLSKYFSPASDGEFHGVRLGISPYNTPKYVDCSAPNIGTNDPLYWMHAAEVYFLRAEAFLIWSIGAGTAESLYNDGVRLSMESYGISSSIINDYINNEELKPAKFIDRHNSSYSKEAMSDITIKWNNTDGYEKNLERIITQKWLAIYPNGQEAWSEFRRTGYPRIFPIALNGSDGKVDTDKQIRRIPLPVEEYTNNRDIVDKAVTSFLNGDDSPGQNLWWDVK